MHNYFNFVTCFSLTYYGLLVSLPCKGNSIPLNCHVMNVIYKVLNICLPLIMKNKCAKYILVLHVSTGI